MTVDDDPPAGGLASPQWLPYVLAGVGLVGGLLVLQYGPLPGELADLLVGGALLALAVGSVAQLVVRGGGPGGRGPDF